MQRPDPALHLQCPICGHPETSLVHHTRIVVTVRCKACPFQWSIGIDGLPESVLKDVQTAILIRGLPIPH